MPLLSVRHLCQRFGERTLFENVCFDLEEKCRVGLVGVNGCGKTTLFSILTGSLEPDEGQVMRKNDLRIGVMRQQLSSGKTLFEEVREVFAPQMADERELQAIGERLRDSAYPADSALIERQNLLLERLQRSGGWYYENRVRSTLLGLGFDEADFSRPIDIFSGGQRSKAAMARLLLTDSQLLLLDEPTNHLDIPSIEWLEGFLEDYPGALLVISHDRFFLDKVTDRTMEIENGKLYVTRGNYSAHCDKRREERETQRRHYETARRDIERIEANITLLKSWNREKSVRAAESREKRVERMKSELEIPPAELEAIHFRFTVNAVSGNEVIEAGELAKGFSAPLFSHLDLHIRKGERVFLYGPNGCGKTTLLKILHGTLSPDRGYVRLGAKVSIGYYDQTQSGLDPEKTAIDELWDSYPRMTGTAIRCAMAAFLFRGDDVFKPVGQLSGGEKARLLLLKLMLAGDNLLLLDEPTNHLDTASCEALEAALSEYDGTLIAVSHDRYFINRMATRMLWMTPQGLISVPGGYDELWAYRQREQREDETAPEKTDAACRQPTAREQAADRRRAGAALRAVEQEIAAAEKEADDLRRRLMLPEIASDYLAVQDIGDRLKEQENLIGRLMERWEALQS